MKEGMLPDGTVGYCIYLPHTLPGDGRYPTKLQRHAIHQRLKTVQLLRNRISHHERVLTAAQALYNGAGVISLAEILECVDWICADTLNG
jgi:hypothetical protein